jgi:uncharacterized repeat protein (TIGR03803 family)
MKPDGALLLASDGALYGTASEGGRENCGAVFRVSSGGAAETVASFPATYPGAGAHLQGGVMQSSNGVLYGVSTAGGRHFLGGVYSVTTNGALSLLASFDGTNGVGPSARLVEGRDGALYGASGFGGSQNFGTVFRVTTNGELTSLISFADTNGAFPYDALTLGADGTLYGTTRDGGPFKTRDNSGYGTVFSVTTDGNLMPLVAFAGTNGAHPSGTLIFGKDGALYGVTKRGGLQGFGPGTMFRVTTNGDLTTLASFGGAAGSSPEGTLFLARDGALYGTSSDGGINGAGTLFKLTTNNTLVVVCSFDRSIGARPSGGVVMGADRALYGICAEQGSRGGGSLFRVDITPPPPLPLRMFPPTFPCPLSTSELKLTGPAGATYRVLRATNVAGPWETLQNVTIGENGLGTLRHTIWGQPRGFYRLATP